VSEPEERAEIRRQILDEADHLLRGNVIVTLARRWREDPETRTWLDNVVHVDPSERVRAGIAEHMVRYWPDERTCDTLRTVITTDPAIWNAAGAAKLLNDLRPDEARDWTYQRLRSPDPYRRIGPLWALRTVWPDHPDTLPALDTAFRTDEEPAIRKLALRGLTELHAASGDEARWRQALDLLLIAVRDPAPEVRVAALSDLHPYCRFDPELVGRTLYDQVRVDDDPQARHEALAVMWRWDGEPGLWPDDPEAVAWLRDFVAADLAAKDRRWAISLLGGFVADPEARRVLLRVAEHHPDGETRSQVIVLYLTGCDDAESKAMAYRLAAGDPWWLVRARSLQWIIGRWEEDPATLELLRDRVVADPDPLVRGRAWDRLVLHTDHEDLAALMVARLSGDPDAEVRQQLLGEYARGYPYREDRAPTTTVLSARATADPDPDVRQHATDLLTALSRDEDLPYFDTADSTRWDYW
jgi:hypothetical protein